ncbi:hypothetical protein [Achromobacter spanius]
MKDRELLELAAQAAAVEVKWIKGFDGKERAHIGAGSYMPMIWNPLTDDGDALRLAVKLGLLSQPAFFNYWSLERFSGQSADDYTAARRAIVRAAAELGKTRSD